MAKKATSEHVATVKAAAEYLSTSFRRKQVGVGVHAVLGKPLTAADDGVLSVQSYRFDPVKFTAAAARAWLKAHRVPTTAALDAAPPVPETNAATALAFHAEDGLTVLVSDLVTEEVFNDRPHWVIPCVLMTEGVFNAALYTADELGAFASSWNGRAVTAWHPMVEDRFVSCAEDPDVFQQYVVGTVFGATVEETDGKHRLKARLYVDQEAAAARSDVLCEMIRNGEAIEVSTGLLSHAMPASGELNGRAYNRVIKDIHPDHLALLPGGKGACSWADGAGAPRLNAAEEPLDDETEGADDMAALKTMTINVKGPTGSFRRAVQDMAEELNLSVNELSHGDKASAVRDALRARFAPVPADGVEAASPSVYVYVTEMYDDTVVYEVDVQNKTRYFRIGYTVDAAGKATLVGEPVEVRRDVQYLPLPPVVTNSQTPNTPEAGTTVPAPGATTQPTVINNEEKQTMDIKTDTPPTIPAVIPPAAPAAVKPPLTLATLEALSKDDATDAGLRGDITEFLGTRVARRKTMVDTILGNSRNRFTAEQLNAKDTVELDALAALATVPSVDAAGTDFGARPAGADAAVQVNTAVPVLGLPSSAPEVK